MKRTSHGAVMSPRMERLWRYVQDERRISLHDFSTDACVERVQKALREGEAELVRRSEKALGDRDLRHLLADYRAIMNRRPHERTTAAMQRSEEAALRARGMAEDEIAAQLKGAG